MPLDVHRFFLCRYYSLVLVVITRINSTTARNVNVKIEGKDKE